MITNIEKKKDCTMFTLCVDIEKVNQNFPETDAKKIMWKEICDYYKDNRYTPEKDYTEMFKNSTSVEKIFCVTENIKAWVYRMKFTVHHVLTPFKESSVNKKTRDSK